MNMPEAMSTSQETVRYEVQQLAPTDPLAAIESLTKEGLAEHFWIYSSEEETRIALGIAGQVVVSGDLIEAEWDDKITASETATDPFAQTSRLLDTMPIEDWRAFGYIMFDTSGFYYPYPFRSATPQMRFIIPQTELVFTDKETQIRTLENTDRITASIQDSTLDTHNSPNVPAPNTSDRELYERQVSGLIKEIRAGQLAKAIISRQVHLPGRIDIFSTYDSIRQNNPAARTFAFQQEGLSGVGSSPELLMKTEQDGGILTNPLAGTRPRGSTPEMDKELRAELLSDPKEINEHVISVRLAKEELESVCRLGSVSIRPFMDVAPFRTVQHLSSSVRGNLADDHTLWDGLRVLFPGVTVSGIDKRTAIEKIADLEQRARGAYAGCVGWVSSHGASDFAITLRSAFEDENGVSISAGAGIVADSVPEREYEETAHKMRTIQTQLVLR
jgi:salicylate synthetase